MEIITVYKTSTLNNYNDNEYLKIKSVDLIEDFKTELLNCIKMLKTSPEKISDDIFLCLRNKFNFEFSYATIMFFKWEYQHINEYIDKLELPLLDFIFYQIRKKANEQNKDKIVLLIKNKKNAVYIKKKFKIPYDEDQRIIL